MKKRKYTIENRTLTSHGAREIGNKKANSPNNDFSVPEN